MRPLITCIWLAMLATAASAHGGEAHGSVYPWTFDPWVVGPITVTALTYVIGSVRLWRRTHSPWWLKLRPSLLFWSGLVTLFLALVSPLHFLGEHLFTFHMIEHEIVMAVAAPLLVLARPIGILLWSLPRPIRHLCAQGFNRKFVREVWQWLTQGTNATVLHGVAIWIWHAPALFDATVADVAVHRLQHLSFFVTAIIFWWSLTWRCSRGLAAWHLFVTMLHTSALGALIALAPTVTYPTQTRIAGEWGLTPLEDQQLAGLIMWVPGGVVYAAVAVWMLAVWIGAASRGETYEHRFRPL